MPPHGAVDVWRIPASYRSDPNTDYTASTISAASMHGEGRVVWADPRYRRSDVTPLKPFGGWPWSDRPQWSNNDLFYLSFAPTRPGGRPRPLRLTPDLSQVTTAVVRPVPKGFVVMWAGRSRVGKDATSAQQPPAVFMEVLPRR